MLMKLVNSKNQISNYWKDFALSLCRMHDFDTSAILPSDKIFGFPVDNFIGETEQINEATSDWIEFFRDRRLLPQLKMAKPFFTDEYIAKGEKLLSRLGDFLIEPEKPSLLHGDLWSGNVLCGNDGKAMLIDPAVYIGHREADIAMTELFGGFPPEFYEAYFEKHPLQEGYENRRDLYNLYHILNHLNLFGENYLSAAYSIIDEYVG